MRRRDIIKDSDMPMLKEEYWSLKKIIFNKYVWPTVILVCIAGIGLTTYKIFSWTYENDSVDNQINNLENMVSIEEVDESTTDIELVNPPLLEEPDEPVIEENVQSIVEKKDDYWDYIKLPLLDVNFDELKAKNSDTVAFLSVNGTNINYPVVQTTDNEYYLKHSFNKSVNNAGWVFMDYRNDINNLQDNTIIYAHGRKNETMFGSLKNIVTSDWYNNTDNYVINLSSPNQNTLWQVVSVYIIPMETYYLTSTFGTEESHQQFLDTIMARSIYDFNTSVNTDDKLLTLSTCYNSVNRVVLHAKLIKRQIN